MLQMFFSEDFQKGSRDKTKNNNMQMKHVIRTHLKHKRKENDKQV